MSRDALGHGYLLIDKVVRVLKLLHSVSLLSYLSLPNNASLFFCTQTCCHFGLPKGAGQSAKLKSSKHNAITTAVMELL